MDNLAKVILFGALIEAAVETVEWVIEREFLRQRLIALAFGLVLAFTFGQNILSALGIGELPAGSPLANVAPVVGQALTGLLLSRGANFVHDLIERLRGSSVPPAMASRS